MAPAREPGALPAPAARDVRLRDFLGYFLQLGTLGFGGPIALVGYMQRDLVERRRWVAERSFAEGLAFSQLAPGPLAAQLAIWLGWERWRAVGATLTGLAFVAPSFLMVLALSVLYQHWGGLPWMRGAFYGIGAVVIAIIARSALKLARRTLRTDPLLWLLFLMNASLVVWQQAERVWVFLASGLVMVLWRERLRSVALHPLALLLRCRCRWRRPAAAVCRSCSGSSAGPVRWYSGAGWRSCRFSMVASCSSMAG